MKQLNSIDNKTSKKVKITFEEVLQNADLKITRSRLEVLKLFFSAKKPLTHQLIMDNLPKNESWDRVTIYRTLSEFSEKKILKLLISNDRISYFELVHLEKSHGHFFCNECGKIECLNKNTFEIDLKFNNSKYLIHSLEILVTGKCEVCNKWKE